MNAKIAELRAAIAEPYMSTIDRVWANRSEYLRWPAQPLLVAPGLTRNF